MSSNTTCCRHGAEGARGSHNPEVTGSKPVAGIVKLDVKRSYTGVAQRQSAGLIIQVSQDQNLSPVFIITSQWCIKALEQNLNRHGAEEARGAHNPEDTGSKPVAGIVQFACFKEVRRHSSRDVKHEQHFTPLAQRQSTQAHNLGVTRSKRVGGILQFACFQKLAV